MTKKVIQSLDNLIVSETERLRNLKEESSKINQDLQMTAQNLLGENQKLEVDLKEKNRKLLIDIQTSNERLRAKDIPQAVLEQIYETRNTYWQNRLEKLSVLSNGYVLKHHNLRIELERLKLLWEKRQIIIKTFEIDNDIDKSIPVIVNQFVEKFKLFTNKDYDLTLKIYDNGN